MGHVNLQKLAPRLGFSRNYKLLNVILQSYEIACKTDSEMFLQIQ